MWHLLIIARGREKGRVWRLSRKRCILFTSPYSIALEARERNGFFVYISFSVYFARDDKKGLRRQGRAAATVRATLIHTVDASVGVTCEQIFFFSLSQLWSEFRARNVSNERLAARRTGNAERRRERRRKTLVRKSRTGGVVQRGSGGCTSRSHEETMPAAWREQIDRVATSFCISSLRSFFLYARLQRIHQRKNYAYIYIYIEISYRRYERSITIVSSARFSLIYTFSLHRSRARRDLFRY